MEPANNVGSGNIAGTDDNPPVKKKKKPIQRFRKFVNEAKENIWVPRPEATLGYRRIEMPQVATQHLDDLLDYVETKGIRVSRKKLSVGMLRASQKEFSKNSILKTMKSKWYKKKKLIVSADYYVVDGHHRWLAAYNAEGEDFAVDVIFLSANFKDIFRIMHQYDKSYQIPVKEDRQRVVYKSGGQNDERKVVTREQLKLIEKFADKIFAKVGIDVEFTRHFFERINDERNKKQITGVELVDLFAKLYKKHGRRVAKFGPDVEAIVKDMMTDINMPFVLKQGRNGMLELVAKTIMRKKNFKPSKNHNDKLLTVEHLGESYSMDQLKKNRLPLTSTERAECMKKEATWHHGPNGEATPAVWKSQLEDGKVLFVTNTHRAMQVKNSLSAAINSYHDFIKGTA